VLKNFLVKLQTKELILMRLLQLELQFKVQFLLVMLRMSFFWMLLHFHWVLRLWEESSQDSSTGTLPFQLRNLRFSQLLLIIKLKSESQFFRVREKWLLIIKNSEILSLVESQWLPEDIHRSKSLLILMPMVF